MVRDIFPEEVCGRVVGGNEFNYTIDTELLTDTPAQNIHKPATFSFVKMTALNDQNHNLLAIITRDRKCSCIP